MLGLRFCARAFSSCGKRGPLSSSRCAGLSLSRPLLLRSTGSSCAGSVVVAHGPSCSAACGIFPDQGSNPCALHWQADSQPLRHQGSPRCIFFLTTLLECNCFTLLCEFLLYNKVFVGGGELHVLLLCNLDHNSLKSFLKTVLYKLYCINYK